jgi:hypothetical protein
MQKAWILYPCFLHSTNSNLSFLTVQYMRQKNPNIIDVGIFLIMI